MQELEHELTSLPLSSAAKTFQERVTLVEKKNFRLGVWSGVLYNLGCSFISRTTVLPSFFSHLTNSSALIGIVGTFQDVGWYLPQFPASAWVVHKRQKMPMYKLSMTLRIILFFGLAFATIFSTEPTSLLIISVLALGFFYLCSGLGGVVFMELFAKAIPPKRRGIFLGIRMALAGILSATIGALAISFLLTSSNFPKNFGFVFLAGAIISSIGLICMAVMREPRDIHKLPKRSLREQMNIAITFLRNDHRFRYYVKTRLLLSIFPLGLPFLFLFAKKGLGFQSNEIAIFITTECIGLVISNYFWSRIARSQSNKHVLLISSVLALAIPLMVIAFSLFELPHLSFALIFAIAAAVDSGYTIGGMSYLIEIIPANERTTYSGLYNSLLAVPILLSFLAGSILDEYGFIALYSILLGFGIISVLYVSRLEAHPLSVSTP
ncbi:MAG: MFS transporter [Ignavibacteriota bacterium]